MTKSPYQVLGVAEDASKDDIKKAYRKKARENHPDLNPNDPGAAARMNEINDAYDRLMNPEKYAKERPGAGAGYGGGAGYGAGGYGGAAGYGAGGYGSGGGSGAGAGGYGYGAGQQGAGGSHYDSGQGHTQYGWSSQEFTWEDLFGFGFAGAGAGSPNDIHPEASPYDSPELQAAISAINGRQYLQATRIVTNIPSTQRNARWYYIASLANYGAGNTSLGYEQIRKACQMDPNNADYRRAMQSFKQPGKTYQQTAQTKGFSMNFDPCVTCCLCVMVSQLCLYPGLFCYRF